MREVSGSSCLAAWSDAVGGRSCSCFMAVAPSSVVDVPTMACGQRRAHRPADHAASVERTVPWTPTGTAFRRGHVDLRRCPAAARGPYAEVMSRSRRWWSALARPAAWLSPGDPAAARSTGPRTRSRPARRRRRVPGCGRRRRAVPQPRAARQRRPAVDRADRRRRRLRGVGLRRRCGGGGGGRSASRSPACCWGRSRSPPPPPGCSRCRPWPCTARSARCWWSPCCGSRRVLVFAAYSPTTGPVSVVLLVTPLVLAASGGGCSSGPAGSCC